MEKAAESLITLRHGSLAISSLAVDFCAPKLSKKEELVGVRTLLDKFVGVRHLHLRSCKLGCSIESEFFSGFPSFLSLRQLELTGRLDCCSTVDAVTRILKGTPNLEVLSLFLMPGKDYAVVMNALNPEVSIECLRRRVRKITMVHYQGNEAQRTLANLLLCNALVLDDLCVVFPKGPLALQAKLMNEMKGWAVNKSARMTYM